MEDARKATLEVEAKVALEGPEAVRSALHRLGATRSPSAVETDVFFRHPMRDFAALDEALRLRATGAGFELTHKGPRLDGAYKARAESTVHLTDDPTALLAALGFQPSLRLTKTRERFRLGALEVTLDHLDGVGWFAEVEAMASDAREAEAAVHAALRELGLADRPRVNLSYAELALAAGAGAAERV